MCGRYRLRRNWEQDLQGYLRLVIEKVDIEELRVGSDEAFPRNRMPIIRLDDDGALVPELRQWGFIMMVKRQVAGRRRSAEEGPPRRFQRDVGEAHVELHMEVVLQGTPLSDPDVELGRVARDRGWQAARARLDAVRPVFAAAGLYEMNKDPKTGESVHVYTLCTVPPNEFLGTVHDRAPMVLLPSQYEAWLAGGHDALALVGTHPDADAFIVERVLL